MSPTVTPAPPTLPASTATGPPPPTPRQAAPAADRHPQRQAPAPGQTPRSRSPATPGPPADVPPLARRSPPTFPSIHPPPTPWTRSSWATRRRRSALQASTRRRSHAKGPGAHAPRPVFCTVSTPFLHPSPAATGTLDAASRTKKPVLAPPKPRNKSQAPIPRPSQRHFCVFCVIPRHYPQSQFRPFYRPPDTV